MLGLNCRFPNAPAPAAAINALRKASGLINGIIPSNTKTRAIAVSRSYHIRKKPGITPALGLVRRHHYRPMGSLKYLKNSESGSNTRMSPDLPILLL